MLLIGLLYPIPSTNTMTITIAIINKKNDATEIAPITKYLLGFEGVSGAVVDIPVPHAGLKFPSSLVSSPQLEDLILDPYL